MQDHTTRHREGRETHRTSLDNSIPDSSENVNSLTQKSSLSTSDPFKYESHHALSDSQIVSYQNRLDSWDGEKEGFSFAMGTTSTVISNLEVDGKKIGNKQVRIDATKIKKLLSEHSEMTIDVVKNLPYLLSDPMLILDSKTI